MRECIFRTSSFTSPVRASVKKTPCKHFCYIQVPQYRKKCRRNVTNHIKSWHTFCGMLFLFSSSGKTLPVRTGYFTTALCTGRSEPSLSCSGQRECKLLIGHRQFLVTRYISRVTSSVTGPAKRPESTHTHARTTRTRQYPPEEPFNGLLFLLTSPCY